MVNKIRRWILRGALTILLFLLSLEVAAQLLRASEMGRAAYIARSVGLPEVYMHPKNLAIKTEHSSLFDWKSDPTVKAYRFRTDAYGTIYPSTFSVAMTKGEHTRFSVVDRPLSVPLLGKRTESQMYFRKRRVSRL